MDEQLASEPGLARDEVVVNVDALVDDERSGHEVLEHVEGAPFELLAVRSGEGERPREARRARRLLAPRWVESPVEIARSSAATILRSVRRSRPSPSTEGTVVPRALGDDLGCGMSARVAAPPAVHPRRNLTALPSRGLCSSAVGNVFLTLMVIGLVGLFVMAIPAFARHGHGHAAHGHAGATARGVAHGRALGAGRAVGTAARGAITRGRNEVFAADPSAKSLLRFLPSPRAVCSALALYGAFGNALVRAGHLGFATAAVAALVPALLVEWFVVRPVWNLVFRFQGQPSSPLEALVLTEATAVVPFRNGRGMVSAVRDGRLVQLAARLRDDQASMPIKVGDRLRIEDVDAERERVTVSLLSGTDLSH